MTFLIRFSAYAASAFFGATIPLATSPSATQADPAHSLVFHSSSREAATDVSMTTAELTAARAEIWALTSAGTPEN